MLVERMSHKPTRDQKTWNGQQRSWRQAKIGQ